MSHKFNIQQLTSRLSICRCIIIIVSILPKSTIIEPYHSSNSLHPISCLNPSEENSESMAEESLGRQTHHINVGD